MRVRRVFPWRQPWSVWSPLAPSRVVDVLRVHVGTEGISALESTVQGDATTRERSIVVARRDADPSPWRFVFRGSIRSGEGGTWLSGVVGPSSALLVSALVWFSVVGLFLLSGVVAVVVDTFSGLPSPLVVWLVLPVLVLSLSYAAYRSAWAWSAARWRSTELWLRELLDAPDAV